jgi:hypothetical protein
MALCAQPLCNFGLLSINRIKSERSALQFGIVALRFIG